MASFRKSPCPPPEWFSRVNLALAVPTCRPTRVKCAVTARGGGGGMAWVALWRAFLNTGKCSFLMISPKLLDISPFFLLIFSPLGTADFLVLLELPGDGYSLLCSKKQPPRHSNVLTNRWNAAIRSMFLNFFSPLYCALPIDAPNFLRY